MSADELGLIQTIRSLQQYGGALPDRVQEQAVTALSAIGEMFSDAIPLIDTSRPVESLRRVEAELNLSRLLHAKATFRLWRLVRDIPSDGIPAWSLFNDPDGRPFQNESAFIVWFTQELGVGRSTIYQMFATLDRMTELGADPERAWDIYRRMPDVIRTALRNGGLLEWDKQHLTGITEKALATVLAHSDETDRAVITELADLVNDPTTNDMIWQDARRKFVEKAGPIVLDFLEELSFSQSSRDAKKRLNHDVLGKPEIIYRASERMDEIVISYLPEGASVHKQFVLTSNIRLPDDVKLDLLNRLPIANRDEVFLD